MPADEEHPYRTAECPIDDALDRPPRRADPQARRSRRSPRPGRSTGRRWPSLRRQAADARAAGNRWAALRKLGEIMTLLGEAARFFRKTAGTTPFYH